MDYFISETEAAIMALRKTGYDPVLKLRGKKRLHRPKKRKKAKKDYIKNAALHKYHHDFT